MSRIFITEKEKEQFNYLEGLNQTKETNVFVARPYIVRNFHLDERDANTVIVKWMCNYDQLKTQLGW